ncbi:MAG: flagellar basal body rod protein FlgB [Oscillospiraceae bacterium]|nr:flagellar basal body rod protein FlgB [Oscillospiraceae bacterium]
MFNKMFSNIDLMHRGLDAAWMRHSVISHNIANVDTPGYKAQHVEFESVLKAAMRGDGGIQMTVTHPGHIQIHPPNPAQARPVTVTDNHYTIRMDDNNVDIDHQMAQMVQNTIQYNALSDRVTSSFSRLKLVIREGR